MKIVFIGAGNLATCMALEMQKAGMTIGQVYSRTDEHAESLARRLNCRWTVNLGEIHTDANLYIFALRDTVIPEVIAQVAPNNGLWVHTAGSLPINVFDTYNARYGVFYPMQTFTRNRKVKLEGTPIFIEANEPDDLKMLKKVAIALSGNAQEADSQKRKYIHLAAVFACNFTNHMYHIAAKILEEQGISHEVFLPLIAETADKLHELSPADAQTGPAVRFDQAIMKQQLALLDNPAMQTIYKLISQNIFSEKITYE